MQVMESTLKPGKLVSLKTSITGLNVNYRRHVLEAEHVTAAGTLEAKWETQKRVLDAAEHDLAKKARADARNAIASACVQSEFGLLCPESNTEKLDYAIARANAIVDGFNSVAKLSHISVYIMAGKIESHDQHAIRAINSEVRDLLLDMESGIGRADVKMIREAANKATRLTAMLMQEPAAHLETAIEFARDTAREIVKNADGGGAIGVEALAVIADTTKYFAF